MSTTFAQPPEKRISARFIHRVQADEALRRLLKRGVTTENMAIVRDFQSKTYIVGFRNKADLVKAGLMKGATHGLVLGAALIAIAEVDTLVLPLLRTVSIGMPGAIFLGALGGGILGSLIIGLGTLLFVSEPLEDERPAVYQTQTQPGTLTVVVDVPAEKSGETFLLLQVAGGEDISSTDSPLLDN